MINNFNLESSSFTVKNFSGNTLATNIPATRDWQASVFVVSRTGRIIPTPYTTNIDDGFVVILFETFLENVDIEVFRNAQLRPPLLQKIFSFGYVTSWLDGFIEVLQDRAISNYRRGINRYQFVRDRTVIWLPNFLAVVVHRIKQNLDFLFNKKTAGLISQCPERPDKQAVVERPILSTPIDYINYQFYVGINEIRGTLPRDKNTGLSILPDRSLSIIKSLTTADKKVTLVLYKQALKGLTPYFKIPENPSATIFIGSYVLDLPIITETDGEIQLETTAIPRGRLDYIPPLPTSRQTVGIKINDLYIPLKFIDLEPTLPVLSGCDVGEDGISITVANWLSK